MKGLIKVCIGGLAMWRMIGLSRVYVGGCSGNNSVGRALEEID